MFTLKNMVQKPYVPLLKGSLGYPSLIGWHQEYNLNIAHAMIQIRNVG